MFKFSRRSLDNLVGVHEDLVKVMTESIKDSPYDFGITEGFRTPQRQKELYDKGLSKTLQGRHMTGHAVDIAVWVSGKLTWDFDYYVSVADHIKKVAKELQVPIVWGGDWRSLKDGPHFELDRKHYPA